MAGSILSETYPVHFPGESGWEQAEGGGSKGGETKRLVPPCCRPLLPRLVSLYSHSAFTIFLLFSGSSTPSYLYFSDLPSLFSSSSQFCSDSHLSSRWVYIFRPTSQSCFDLIANTLQSHIVFLPFIRMMRKVDFTSPKDEVSPRSNN